MTSPWPARRGPPAIHPAKASAASRPARTGGTASLTRGPDERATSRRDRCDPTGGLTAGPLPGQPTTDTKNSSICRTAAMNWSTSTGLVTYALACSL